MKSPSVSPALVMVKIGQRCVTHTVALLIFLFCFVLFFCVFFLFVCLFVFVLSFFLWRDCLCFRMREDLT